MTDTDLSAGDLLRQDMDELLEAHDKELDAREAALLEEACLTADLLADLQEAIDREGSTYIDKKTGEAKVQGLVIEQRLSRQAFQRLLSGIELPTSKANALASRHGRIANSKRKNKHSVTGAGR
jgi:hypothetical protein